MILICSSYFNLIDMVCTEWEGFTTSLWKLSWTSSLGLGWGNPFCFPAVKVPGNYSLLIFQAAYCPRTYFVKFKSSAQLWTLSGTLGASRREDAYSSELAFTSNNSYCQGIPRIPGELHLKAKVRVTLMSEKRGRPEGRENACMHAHKHTHLHIHTEWSTAIHFSIN